MTFTITGHDVWTVAKYGVAFILGGVSALAWVAGRIR